MEMKLKQISKQSLKVVLAIMLVMALGFCGAQTYAATASTNKAKTTANLQLRKKATTSSKVLTTIPKGKQVTVLKKNAAKADGYSWYQVKYSGKTGYAASKYLKTAKKQDNKKNNSKKVIKGKRTIDPSKPMVALTFDDGPNGKATPKILDTLEKYNAVATFFDLGSCMKNYPKVTKREAAIGCEVESHTYAHQNLNKLSASQIKADIKKAEKVYKQTLGHKPSLVRPPYGNANATVRRNVNYPLINWDVDTLDWKSRNAKSIMKEIHKIKNFDGRVILMHSIYTSTADAVKILVPELKKKGYQFVTVSEMAHYEGVNLKAGKVYCSFR